MHSASFRAAPTDRRPSSWQGAATSGIAEHRWWLRPHRPACSTSTARSLPTFDKVRFRIWRSTKAAFRLSSTLCFAALVSAAAARPCLRLTIRQRGGCSCTPDLDVRSSRGRNRLQYSNVVHRASDGARVTCAARRDRFAGSEVLNFLSWQCWCCGEASTCAPSLSASAATVQRWSSQDHILPAGQQPRQLSAWLALLHREFIKHRRAPVMERVAETMDSFKQISGTSLECESACCAALRAHAQALAPAATRQNCILVCA